MADVLRLTLRPTISMRQAHCRQKGEITTGCSWFPCSAQSCVKVPGGPGRFGLPYFNCFAGNYAALGDGTLVPLIDPNNTFQFAGSLTWTRRVHGVGAGLGSIRRQGLTA